MALPPGMTAEETVFVVDPDMDVGTALRDLAATMNLSCEVYASGQEFLAAYDPSRTGCVLLELRLPGLNGTQIQEYLNSRQSILPVIFFASQVTVSTTVRLMRAGALTVLEKPFREHELWDAISEAVEVSRSRQELQAHREQRRRLLEMLTEKELDVLRLLVEGKSRKVIARELGICLRTLEIRRNQLMKKLQAKTLAELVRFAVVAEDGHFEGLEYRGPLRPVDGNVLLR